MRILLIVLVVACAQAPVGVQNVELAPDSAQQCAGQCHSIGLTLDSVVVMANNVGCVCRAVPQPASTTPPGVSASSSAGGMTAIMIQMEAARRQVAAQQQRQQRKL